MKCYLAVGSEDPLGNLRTSAGSKSQEDRQQFLLKLSYGNRKSAPYLNPKRVTEFTE
ncbi:MAG: hypothetical protein R6U04_07050 [Bacteroidales bacterium]